MADRFVAAVGGYLPLLRLDRKIAASALRWTGLGGLREGRRAVAGWDEDALTMAVEAARSALAESDQPQAIWFASTSAPFNERAQSALLVEALALPPTTRSSDAAGSRRCAVSALLCALQSSGCALVAAGERRPTKAGSPLQLAYGDGGAAVLVDDKGAARLIGAASYSRDFLDIYASPPHPTPYQAEERFVRETAAQEFLGPTILAACRNAGIEPNRIGVAAVAEPVAGTYQLVARQLELPADNLVERVQREAGDLGAAMPLFAFALALSQAKIGDIVLLAGFGSGCDALLFEMAEQMPQTSSADEALATGEPLNDYVRFLSLTGSLELDWGVRSETEQKAAATVLHRHGREMHGFIGGRDAAGVVQFPKSPVPVDPAANGAETLQDVRLADEPAQVVSVTADRLTYTPDPPFAFGLAQFGNGARVLMEFTDTEANPPSVGDPLVMRFRVKSVDRKRGFRTYFWKAAPVSRPALGD